MVDRGLRNLEKSSLNVAWHESIWEKFREQNKFTIELIYDAVSLIIETIRAKISRVFLRCTSGRKNLSNHV